MINNRTFRPMIVGLLSASAIFAPVPAAVAEQPVHLDPNLPRNPKPDIPIINPTITTPQLFQTVWNLNPTTPTSFLVVSESNDPISFPIVVLNQQGVTMATGDFEVSARFEMQSIAAMLDSAFAAAIVATPNENQTFTHQVFSASGYLTGNASSRWVVMIGTTLTITRENAVPIHRTFFFPVAIRNTESLATAAANRFSLSPVSQRGTDNECTLTAQQLQQLTCEERANYNYYCDVRSCERQAIENMNEAGRVCALALIACTVSAIAGPWFSLICTGIAYAGFHSAMALIDANLAECTNNAERSRQNALVNCGGSGTLVD